jgi:hypothetical protein
MRCYNQAHRFYCGVDLHARTLAVSMSMTKVPMPQFARVNRTRPVNLSITHNWIVQFKAQAQIV